MTLQQIVVLLALTPVLVLSITRRARWAQDPTSSDQVFEHNLLWSGGASSQLSCAQQCTDDARCVSFTFTKMTPGPRTCRGHSQKMTSGGSVVAETTYFDLTHRETLYYLGSRWLQKPCTSNSECSEPQSECFSQRCLCTPGYFFSHSKDGCQADCSELHDELVVYPQHYLALSNSGSGVKAWAECRAWCMSLPDCLSLEYSSQDSRCFVANVTVLDAPGYWKQAKSDLSYWQRTCA